MLTQIGGKQNNKKKKIDEKQKSVLSEMKSFSNGTYFSVRLKTAYLFRCLTKLAANLADSMN